MREWRIIRLLAWREIYSRRKIFLLTTAAAVVIVAGAMTLALGGDDEPPQITVAHAIDLPAGFAASVAGNLDPDASVTLVQMTDRAEIETALLEGEAVAAIVGELDVLWSPEAGFSTRSAIAGAMSTLHVARVSDEAGLSDEELARLLQPVEGTFIGGERDEATEFLSVISVILSFTAILAYGQWVAYGVVEEKSNRIIEIILGAARPRQVLWAKIIAIGSLGLMQLGLIVVTALVFARRLDTLEIPAVTGATAAWLVGWFLLGFLFYASVYAAAGSLAGNSQEAGSTIGPLNLLPIIGYMSGVAMLAQATPPTALRVLSFIPLWSPLTMPGLLARGWATPLEALASAGILLVSVWLMIRLAARIYAGGVTQSTRTVSWREAFRSGGDLGRE